MGVDKRNEHYKDGFQVIDAIAIMGMEFNLGSVLKYVVREKGDIHKKIEDYQKAIDYCWLFLRYHSMSHYKANSKLGLKNNAFSEVTMTNEFIGSGNFYRRPYINDVIDALKNAYKLKLSQVMILETLFGIVCCSRDKEIEVEIDKLMTGIQVEMNILKMSVDE